MKFKFLLFMVSMCLLSTVQAQNTIHVPGDQPTIQAGINAAIDGDMVLVDQGTYYENIDFKGKAITVKSYFDPGSPDSSFIYNTIIDGSQPVYKDSASVVYFINGEDTSSVISGFTIRGGSGTKVFDYDLVGGGIFCYESGAKIIYNVIMNNHLSDTSVAGSIQGSIAGGGILCYDNLLQHYVIIKHNTISGNSCSRFDNGYGYATGGGISVVYYNECFIENNKISNNIAYNGIDGLFSMGGGIELDDVKGFVHGNIISENEIVSTSNQGNIWGAGMYCYALEEGSLILNNTIKGNMADAPFSKGGGLGIGFCQDEVTIDGNLIVGNSALFGGGMAVGATPGVTTHITNNVIRGNYAQQKNGGLRIQGSFKGSPASPGDLRGRISDKGDNNSKSSGAIVLVNNTFCENEEYTTNYSSAAEVMVTSDNVPLVAFNNIFYNTTESDKIIRLEGNSVSYFYNNILDEDRIYNQITAQWEGVNNFYADPLLMEDSIHLSDGSPCIEAGVENIEIAGELYYCPTIDFEYEARPLGVTDIGADEWYPDTRVPTIAEINAEIFIYPNPVNGSAYIRYSISDPSTNSGQVNQYSKLSIYDAYGRLVDILLDEVQQPGVYEVSWNAEGLPVGIYLVQLKIGNEVTTRKIIKQ